MPAVHELTRIWIIAYLQRLIRRLSPPRQWLFCGDLTSHLSGKMLLNFPACHILCMCLATQYMAVLEFINIWLAIISTALRLGYCQ